MKNSSTGILKRLIQLASGYHLLHFELEGGSHVEPGNTLSLDNTTFGVMRHHQHSHTVELLGPAIPPHWQEGDRQTYVLNKSNFGPSTQTTGENNHLLLIAEGRGMAQIVFLAERLKQQSRGQITILLGFDGEMPFRPAPSRIMTPSLPPHVIASVPLLEEWGIACRIAHEEGAPGCYEEKLPMMAAHWLNHTNRNEFKGKIEIFACARKATNLLLKRLAGEHELPCQTIEI
ncbi:hypothetical protein ACFL2V_13485 [Pseudomonadota bacterium]